MVFLWSLFHLVNKNIFFTRKCQFTSVDSPQRLRGAKVGLHFTLSSERNKERKKRDDGRKKESKVKNNKKKENVIKKDIKCNTERQKLLKRKILIVIKKDK